MSITVSGDGEPVANATETEQLGNGEDGLKQPQGVNDLLGREQDSKDKTENDGEPKPKAKSVL